MNRFIIRFPEFRRKALTLSYDDGPIQDKRLIEVIDKYGLKCTFNLMGTKLAESTDCAEPTLGKNVLRHEALEVYKNHEVCVHGFEHPFLDVLPAGNAAWQIIKDREVLESLFGKIIRGMAYPMGGTQSDELVSAVRACGILYARTTQSTHKFDIPKDWLRLSSTCHFADEQCLDLAKEFVDLKVPYLSKMFYVWGHSYEFDRDNGWEKLEEFCRIASGKDDIWYATNGQIFEYLEAANRLCCSADGKILHNPTATDICIDDGNSDRQYVIHSGETIIA